MSTETTNKKIKIDNGTIFGKTYTDKAVDELLKNARDGAIFEITSEQASKLFDKFDITDEQYQFIINNKSVSCLLKIQGTSAEFPVTFTRMIQDNEIAAFFSLGIYYALSCTSSDVNPATNKHMLRFQANIMDFYASLSIYENEQDYNIYGTQYITYFDTIKGANILHEHNFDTKNWQFTEDKTISLFGKHSILVPKDSADTGILSCNASDNGKVLSVVNGEAQWASAGGGGGGVGIIDISSTWSAITPTDFTSLKFKSYLVGNMIYIEIKAIFKNRPATAMALFQNTTYIISEDVTLPFFDGLDAKRIVGNDNKKLYVVNPVDSYRFYMSGWFTIEV